MVYSKNTATPYHQQDTDYYCGAAVAQMILESIGSGILDQDTLYNSNHNHNTQSGWATDPNGLNYTLNHYKPLPPTFNSYFIVETTNSELDGSRRIVGTLENYKVATGTLVFNCQHWIAVRGFCTDTQPTNPTYTIYGFYINNPWPPTPSFYNSSLAPPPPHANNDGCGTSGDHGIANEYVSYTQWQNTYLTGCDVWGVGHKQYISVCDPRLPKLGDIILRPEPRWAKGDHILTVAEVTKLIPQILLNHCIFFDEFFAAALKEATVNSPILVQRLDLADTYYYLVPMKTKEGITALLTMDGLYGEFHGGQALSKPIKEFLMKPAEAQRELAKKLFQKPIDLGRRDGKLTVRDGAHCFYPAMVWKPCQESRSPYYPFYMVTVGNRQIYIGYDGKIHTELHDILPGG